MERLLYVLFFAAIPVSFIWIWLMSKDPNMQRPLSSLRLLLAAAKQGNVQAIVLLAVVAACLLGITVSRLGEIVAK